MEPQFIDSEPGDRTTAARACSFRPLRALSTPLALFTQDSTTDAATCWQRAHAGEERDLLVAYFSMEFGIEESLPIYSGGLGILAGDHLKAAAELGIPVKLIGVGEGIEDLRPFDARQFAEALLAE